MTPLGWSNGQRWLRALFYLFEMSGSLMARTRADCATRAHCPGPSSGVLRTTSTSAILMGAGPRTHCCLFLDFFPLGTLQKTSCWNGAPRTGFWWPHNLNWFSLEPLEELSQQSAFQRLETHRENQTGQVLSWVRPLSVQQQ